MRGSIVVLAACAPGVPDVPSYQEHVAPILAANCLRCHGAPAIGGAPASFRLDSYGDLPDPDDPAGVAGAASLASDIAARVASRDRPMPPRFALDDYQIETLARWAENPIRGPRADNLPPEVTATVAGLTVTVRTDDPDGDVVAGELRIVSVTTEHLVGLVRTGTVALAIDPTWVMTPGVYQLVAHVDDGAEVHVLDAASFEVSP